MDYQTVIEGMTLLTGIGLLGEIGILCLKKLKKQFFAGKKIETRKIDDEIVLEDSPRKHVKTNGETSAPSTPFFERPQKLVQPKPDQRLTKRLDFHSHPSMVRSENNIFNQKEVQKEQKYLKKRVTSLKRIDYEAISQDKLISILNNESTSDQITEPPKVEIKPIIEIKPSALEVSFSQQVASPPQSPKLINPNPTITKVLGPNDAQQAPEKKLKKTMSSSHLNEEGDLELVTKGRKSAITLIDDINDQQFKL